MNKEYFKILKEINSHLQKIHILNHEINEENKRVIKIKSRRSENEDLIEAHQKEILSIKEKLEEDEIKLETKERDKKQFKEAMNLAKNEKELKLSSESLKNTENELIRLEEIVLLALETLEKLEKESEEAKTFLKGSLTSLLEIENEAKVKIKELENEIQGLETRINHLKDELPILFKSKFESVLKKNHKISPFTEIEGSHCGFCKYELSRIDLQEIETKLTLKTCSSCGRLFIPRAALF